MVYCHVAHGPAAPRRAETSHDEDGQRIEPNVGQCGARQPGSRRAGRSGGGGGRALRASVARSRRLAGWPSQPAPFRAQQSCAHPTNGRLRPSRHYSITHATIPSDENSVLKYLPSWLAAAALLTTPESLRQPAAKPVPTFSRTCSACSAATKADAVRLAPAAAVSAILNLPTGGGGGGGGPNAWTMFVRA